MFDRSRNTNRMLEKVERLLLRFHFLFSRAFFFRCTWNFNLLSALQISTLSYVSILASFQRCYYESLTHLISNSKVFRDEIPRQSRLLKLESRSRAEKAPTFPVFLSDLLVMDAHRLRHRFVAASVLHGSIIHTGSWWRWPLYRVSRV